MKSDRLEIEKIHVFGIVKQMYSVYAGIMYPYKIKNQTVLSTRKYKQNKNDQVLGENEYYISLKNIQILTQ